MKIQWTTLITGKCKSDQWDFCLSDWCYSILAKIWRIGRYTLKRIKEIYIQTWPTIDKNQVAESDMEFGRWDV